MRSVPKRSANTASRADAALLARALGQHLELIARLAPELVRLGARIVGVERARQLIDELEKEAST